MKTKTIDTRSSEAIIIRNPNLERFFKEIEPFKRLSQVEERELILRSQQGCLKSREMLTKCNLKFVVCCAKEYQKYGIEILDLINIGTIGLIESIDKYDLKKNWKLITYSVWWIKSRIIEYIRESENIVSIPFNQQDELQKIEKFKEKLESKLNGEIGYDQAIEELLKSEEIKDIEKKQEELKEKTINLDLVLVDNSTDIIDLQEEETFCYSVETINSFEQVIEEIEEVISPLRTLDNTVKTPEEYYEYIRPSLFAKSDSVSLDATMSNNEEGEAKLSDFISDKSSNFLEDIVKRDRSKILYKAISSLPKVNQRILSLFFGLEDNIVHTNEDISKILNLTSERIRQLKNSSLETLKTNRALLGVL